MIPDFILDVDVPEYQLDLADEPGVEMDVGMTSGGGGTRDHNVLINRDMEDQHPINAITRLNGELEARPAQALTNMDIQLILNS